jgi:hypothetical protein
MELNKLNGYGSQGLVGRQGSLADSPCDNGPLLPGELFEGRRVEQLNKPPKNNPISFASAQVNARGWGGSPVKLTSRNVVQLSGKGDPRVQTFADLLARERREATGRAASV